MPIARNLIAAAAMLASASGMAKAEDCKPLQYVTGVPMTPAKGAILVPVTLNGAPSVMLFDTGGIANQLSRNTVKALGLHEYDSPLELLDASGNLSRTYVKLDKFSIGRLNVPNMQFQVSTLFSADDKVVAGLLASNFLRAFDVDIDFSAGRMNFFMPDHCPGKVIYWPVNTVAAVPITIDATHIIVPVRVDGRAMRAIIDTGAYRTTMNMTYAESLFDLKPGSPDMTALDEHPNGDKSITLYRHTFSSLSFEGVTVKNPSMVIMPDKVNSKQDIVPTGSHIKDRDIALPELLIGFDVLSKLHLYISYHERMLYISPPDDKAAKMLPPVDTAPTGAP